jgi:chromosome segregation ATPase
MKLDNKSILITVLFFLLVFFIYKEYFETDDSYKEDIERLNAKNESLIAKRDSLTFELDSIKGEYVLLKEMDSILSTKIEQSQDSIIQAKREAYLSKKLLRSLQAKIEKNKKEIDSLNKAPDKSDEILLKSLKIKLNK